LPTRGWFEGKVYLEEFSETGRLMSIIVKGHSMRVIILSIFFVSIMFGAAIAKDATECAKVVDANDRLNCFDSIYREVKAVETKSAWDLNITTSALDDSQTVVLRLQSEDEIRGKYGDTGAAVLLIRCMENTTSSYIIFNDQFMSDIQGGGRVDYRIDKNDPTYKNMDVSSDNKALGLWNGRRSIPWIKSIMGGARLYVRATPYSESPVEANFVISGLSSSIGPLRDACNW
jgi:type VI secretion system protein VasI